jgi:hypothetical protein
VTVLKVAVAFVAFALLIRAGVWMIRVVSSQPPPPPPKGELRKIDARYRCTVCGMEMKVVLAPDEDPEPPRHCMEEMDLVRQD